MAQTNLLEKAVIWGLPLWVFHTSFSIIYSKQEEKKEVQTMKT